MKPNDVRLFGRPELHVEGRVRYFSATQVFRFLAYLAFRAGWVRRDEVTFLFWPDRVDAVARRNLRKLLHHARRQVDGIEVEGDRIRWLVLSDVPAWRDALGRRDASVALAACLEPLMEGLDVGAPVEFAAWLERERGQARLDVTNCILARCAELEAVDPEAATALSVALLRVDPLDARVVQCCLRSLARAGRSAELAQVYRDYVRALQDDMNVEPDEATRALYLALAAAADLAHGEGVARTSRSTPRSGREAGPTRAFGWDTPPFVGRRRELTQLHECLASALAGRGGVVVVEGEGGAGKTRLVEHFLSQVGSGLEVFRGRCHEQSPSTPMEPVRRALGAWDGDAGVSGRSHAQRFVAGETAERRGALRTSSTRLVAAARRGRGAVLFVDDLQWADAATLAFLTDAAHRVRGEPVLLVVSHRHEDRGVLEPWRAGLAERRAIRTVRVDRFEAGQTHHLVAEILGGNDADLARVAAFVHAEAEGNPYYTVEYLRWLRDTEVLQVDGRHRLARVGWARLAQAPMPESIRALIWARYRAFDKPTRVVLDAAAVIGRTFTFDLLEAVTGTRPLALWSTFEPLITAGLMVRVAEGSYAFSHDKVRQTVYEGLAPPVRKALHGRVATALEVNGVGDAELEHHRMRAEARRPRT